MKKALIILILPLWCFAQGEKSKEVNYTKGFTIYVTDNKNTTLIFDDGIERGIPGYDNFEFSYDRSFPGPVGLLKGTNGPESNLLVITENGNMYNFTLAYKRKVEKTTYFIKDSMANGNIHGKIIYQEDLKKQKILMQKTISEATAKEEKLPISIYDYETPTVTYEKGSDREKEELLYNTDKEEFIRKFCSNETSKETFFRRKFESSGGVFFQIKNLVYNHNELYFAFIIDNESNLDYDVRDLSVYLVAKEKSKSTSSQRILIKPMYIYNQPERVEGKKQRTFVYVFDKFSVGPKKSVEIELLEHKGERNITLALDVNTINNPN